MFIVVESLPEPVVMSRSRAEMRPSVREYVSSPRGLPMAITAWPTFSWSESPRVTVWSPEASIFSTATSLSSSPPTRVAG